MLVFCREQVLPPPQEQYLKEHISRPAPPGVNPVPPSTGSPGASRKQWQAQPVASRAGVPPQHYDMMS